MSNVTITYSGSISDANPEKDGILVIGRYSDLIELKENLAIIRPKFGQGLNEQHFLLGFDKLSSTSTDTVELFLKNFTLASMPSTASRHNAPMHPNIFSSLVKSSTTRSETEHVVIVCDRQHTFALGCAVARVFPLYSKKKNSGKNKVDVRVEFVFTGNNKESLSSGELDMLDAAANSIRLAAKIVDAPCLEMHTNIFLEEIKNVKDIVLKDVKGIQLTIIQGEELNKQGFGGIYGVGKAAVNEPALAVLTYTPENKDNSVLKSIAWCGKGIVYDTGGLSMKTKTTMPGMKCDCGGAAAVLGAFAAAVKADFKAKLHAVFCLAENAVGPHATRPDDVHNLYSGLSVEINNTDAEGRLVLGDGVAYAKTDLKADIIVDLATLTGAQGVATGQYHAAILTNNEEWEQSCMKAGKISGDLVFPVPYSPELHFDEFKSVVADMKNSVKDRSNAQVSCAGLFIGSHIGFDYPGVWLHVDMAAPVERNERGTGYGVALLLTLFGKYTHNKLLNSIAPF